MSKSGVFLEKVSVFFFSIEINFRWKFFANFRKSAKNFFNRKKLQLQVSKSGVFAPEKVSQFMKKKNSVFSKICEKNFLSEKNPTSSVKIGGFCSRKVSLIFFYRNKVQVRKKKSQFSKSAKNLFYRKKIRLQVSKSSVFCEKNVPQICWNFGHN